MGICCCLLDPVRVYLVLQLRRPRGLPKFAEVAQDTAECGLGCGLKMIAGSNAYLRFRAVLKALLRFRAP
jgi:hypothetical protein